MSPTNTVRRPLYVVRILRGESASNLPVQQATNMRFTINRKTADTLGIVIPPHLYILADEVIE
jgi:putative ABC transport system substrate-binding protein